MVYVILTGKSLVPKEGVGLWKLQKAASASIMEFTQMPACDGDSELSETLLFQLHSPLDLEESCILKTHGFNLVIKLENIS